MDSNEKAEVVKDWVLLEKNSSFTRDKVGKDYLHVTAELTKIPVSKIILKCNKTNYTIWIVGKNKIVFYDKIPSLVEGLFGRLNKLFHVN